MFRTSNHNDYRKADLYQFSKLLEYSAVSCALTVLAEITREFERMRQKKVKGNWKPATMKNAQQYWKVEMR